jgi:asparagine synthase (glutamine-hydrolysing)
MCGIFYTTAEPSPSVLASSRTLSARGPDARQEKNVDGHFFAFHRLAINDLSDAGMQPFITPEYAFVCNGEIYNSLYLRALLEDSVSFKRFSSNSDCEVVPRLIVKYGIDAALSMIEGVFAFVFLDRRHGHNGRVIIARDAIGVKSLYSGIVEDEVHIPATDEMTGISVRPCTGPSLVVASEMKALHALSAAGSVSQFPAGHYYDSNTCAMTRWADMNFHPRFPFAVAQYTGDNEDVHSKLRELLTEAVRVRLTMSDRPVGCFLSGGLDSSLVAAIAAKLVRERSNGKEKIKTFSVGIKGATDLECAKAVAYWIGAEHHELVLSEKDMIQAVPKVIKRIESYDVTTVRASTPMVLLSDWIKKNFDTTVLFSGEGADELSGSYRYFQNAPSDRHFQEESVRLVKDLQYFDVLRCDKSVSGSGLEARTPFFDMNFVNYYMRLDPALKRWGGKKNIEKQLLRDAFNPKNGERGLLPPVLLYRRKEAFSDGCSSMERPWFKVIDDHVNSIISDVEYAERRLHFPINQPISKEGYWFRAIYEKFYPLRGAVVPYIWRPKWTTETNPSARLLMGDSSEH